MTPGLRDAARSKMTTRWIGRHRPCMPRWPLRIAAGSNHVSLASGGAPSPSWRRAWRRAWRRGDWPRRCDVSRLESASCSVPGRRL